MPLESAVYKSLESAVYKSLESLMSDSRERERKLRFELEKSQLEVEIYKTRLSEVHNPGNHCVYALLSHKEVGGAYSDYCLGVFKLKSQALSEQHKTMKFDNIHRALRFSIRTFNVQDSEELENGKNIYIIYQVEDAVNRDYYFLKDISLTKPDYEFHNNRYLYTEYCNLK